MSFPDPLDRPSRTIITGEGGKTASRFKHVVLQDDTLRRLTPIELERLNMFPDNHTALDSITDFQTQANVVIAATLSFELHRELLLPKDIRRWANTTQLDCV